VSFCIVSQDQYIDYDKSKTRAENYKALRKIFDKYISIKEESSFGRHCDYCIKYRESKGAHLDWNYTEKLSDLIEQGIVKVPITDFDVIFVEWSAGNLDEVELTYKYEKALFDWDGKKWPGCFEEESNGLTRYWNKRNLTITAHKYNDSNREEYNPVILLPAPSPVSDVQYGNYADAIFIPLQEREHTAFWVTGIAE